MRVRICLAACALCVAAMGVGRAVAAEGARILLASEDTKFKNALVEKMQAALKEAGFEVVTADHADTKLKNQKAADYAAVFITNSGVRSKVRPWVVEWVEGSGDDASRILLHTTQTKDWEVKLGVDVDAVTSASDTKSVEKLAADYVKRLTAMATPKEDAAATDSDAAAEEGEAAPADE